MRGSVVLPTLHATLLLPLAVPVLPLLGLPADVAGLADTTGEDEAAGGNGA